MIQRMLAIWSLVPLPFLKPAWTSGSSRFTYCWSLAWRTPLPIWNQSLVPCPVLTVASWPAYKVSQEAGRVVWYSHLFQNFPQFIVIHTVKGFGIGNKSEIDVFLELLLFQWSSGCWQFDLWFSAFSKTSLNICKFMVHVLLKPGLENFKHYFTSVWDESNCAVVWAFFGLPFFGIGMKTDLFQSCGHWWVFQIC